MPWEGGKAAAWHYSGTGHDTCCGKNLKSFLSDQEGDAVHTLSISLIELFAAGQA